MIAILKAGTVGLIVLSLAAVARAGEDMTAMEDSGPKLTLDMAIRLALENNRNIKVEAYAPAIARANLLTAKGQFDPALSFGRTDLQSYSYPDLPQPESYEKIEENTYGASLGGTLPLGTSYSIYAEAVNERGPYNNFTNDFETFDGVSITQPLLQGFGLGVNLVNVRIARANRAINEWEYRLTVMNTVASVVTAYSNLVLAHDQLHVAQDNRDQSAKILEEDKELFVDGSGSKSDVVSAQAQLAGTETLILTRKRSIHTVENQLRELMGESSFITDGPLFKVEVPVPPDVPIRPAEDLQSALANRPDYQAARLGIVINRASDTAARNGLLPQVNFVGGYGYYGLSQNFAASRRMVADREFPSYSAGLEVTIPLTFAQGRGRARAARLTLQQSEESLKELEAEIALTVANDAGQIETALVQLATARNAYDLAQQALVSQNKKFNEGRSTALAVIQEETLLITAETGVANAQSLNRLAVVNYDTDLGRILARYHITLADK